MVTFGGAKDSLYRGLRSLPRRPYLAAMWILCGELQVLYAPWTNDEVTSLMASTMDLVREAAISGESAEVAQRGLELARAWAPVIEAKDAEPGSPGALLNAWATFEGLAQEIGGLSGRYDGANWATLAVADRWRDWDEPGPIIMSRVNAEEVDASSPMGQTLAWFRWIVKKVAWFAGPECDPVRIRAAILEGPLLGSAHGPARRGDDNQSGDGANRTGRGPGRRGGRTAVHPADPVPALLDQ
jgi:hypothetical protein